MIKLKIIEVKLEQVLASPSLGRAQRMMQSKFGLWLVAIVSFVESALPVPILTDPFLIAGILLNRQKALFITAITIVASVLGGLCAYFLALLFLEGLMQFMSPAMISEFNSLVSSANPNTFIITILGAVSPIPYTLVAWAIAALQGSVLIFLLSSLVGRTIRYAIVGYCVYQFGPAASYYVRRYIGLITMTLFILIALYFGYLWYQM